MALDFSPSFFGFGLSILPNFMSSIGQGLSKSRVDRDLLRIEKQKRVKDINETSNDLITNINMSNLAGGVREGTHTAIINQKAFQAKTDMKFLMDKQRKIMESSRDRDFLISGATAGVSLAGLYGFEKYFGPNNGNK